MNEWELPGASRDRPESTYVASEKLLRNESQKLESSIRETRDLKLFSKELPVYNKTIPSIQVFLNDLTFSRIISPGSQNEERQFLIVVDNVFLS